MHGKAVAASLPITPAGAFYNDPSFKDYFELRDRLADRGDDFLRGLIENLYAYALGRPVSFADADTIDALVAQADGLPLVRLGRDQRNLVPRQDEDRCRLSALRRPRAAGVTQKQDHRHPGPRHRDRRLR